MLFLTSRIKKRDRIIKSYDFRKDTRRLDVTSRYEKPI